MIIDPPEQVTIKCDKCNRTTIVELIERQDYTFSVAIPKGWYLDDYDMTLYCYKCSEDL